MAGVVQLALRLAILAGVALAAVLAVSLTRRYAAQQHRLALAGATDDEALPRFDTMAVRDAAATLATPRILAFSSPYCSPCHTLQEPALRSVAATLGSSVEIETVDATEHAELAARYRVMTLPATVVFDPTGRPTAVNYGFTGADKLLAQLAEATSLHPHPAG